MKQSDQNFLDELRSTEEVHSVAQRLQSLGSSQPRHDSQAVANELSIAKL